VLLKALLHLWINRERICERTFPAPLMPTSAVTRPGRDQASNGVKQARALDVLWWKHGRRTLVEAREARMQAPP